MAAALAVLAGAREGSAQSGAFWVRHDGDRAERLRLLHELREHVLAGDRGRALAAIAALQARAARAQATLRGALAQGGFTVRFSFWLTDAISVQALHPADVACLRTLPGALDVLPVGTAAPCLRKATGDRFTNADVVHQDPRFTGRGCGVAVIDSGIARSMAGTGQPHRTFRRLAGPGHRLVGAYGIGAQGQPSPPPDDFDGHGTAVASIVAGVDWGAPPWSDHGFAFDSDLVSYRVVDATGAAPDDAIAAALQQIALDRVRHEVKVANLSLAGQPDPNHPQQVVLDVLGYFTDVLVVTAAGNDGLFPHPAARSHANCSGLSVGAVIDETRRVDPASSWGPLPGDGERFWPDLVALGQLHAAKHDDENAARALLGTSFAAPQVAGTAAMLRGADPSLTALDAKAALLHGVEDIAAANPSHDRYRYGLGMLRADLAVAALQHDRLLRGSLRQGSTTSVEWTFDLTVGHRYAATLVFARTSPGNQPEWDDLNLYVYAPDGRLRTASESPRNLYEKVVFDAQQSGPHRVQVVARSFTTPASFPVPFSLIFGADRSGATQRGSWLSLGHGCPGSGQNPANGIIVPPEARTAFGNDNTRVPLAEEPCRVQQVVEHGWLGNVPPFALHRIGFRRDSGEANSAHARVDLDIHLGYSSRAAAQMLPSFSANADLGPMTRVRSGWIDLPGANRRSEFAYWDHVAALDTPFLVDTRAGRNLLVEFTVRGNDQGNRAFPLWFDAVTGPGVGRVYQFASTGVVFEPTALVLSLMQDGLTPAVPLLDPVGDARPGEPFSLVVRNAMPSARAVLVHGLSRTSWNGFTLPLDLAPLGAPGCKVYTDWFLQVPVWVDNVGQRRIDWLLPPAAALSGTVLHVQLFVADPANALGVVASDGGRIVVGG